MPKRPIQRELAKKDRSGHVRDNLPRAQKDDDCDGEVVGRALFLQVGGGQAYGYPANRKLIPRIADGCPYAFPRLLHRLVREADDTERRESRGDVHLDLDNASFQATTAHASVLANTMGTSF